MLHYESSESSVARGEDLAWEGVPPGSNGSDVLKQRLAQLGDADWMKRILQAAMEQLAGAPVSVDAYAIEYCKVKPRRHINAAINLKLRRSGAAESLEHRISCTICSSADAAQAKFREETKLPVPEHGLRRPEAAGFHRLTTYLPEMAMVVRLFPVDPALVGLGLATDASCMADLLRRYLPDCRDGWRPKEIGYEALHYKPGRSCTLCYRLTLEHPASIDVRTRQVFAKLYRDDRGTQCYGLLNAAWQASDRSEGAWRAARPVAHVPDWRLFLQEAVPGKQFRHLFAELTHDGAGAAELQEVERHLSAIALALRSLQRCGVELGPRRRFAELLSDQEKNLAYLSQFHEGLASRIDRVRAELACRAQEIPEAPLSFAHCDLAHGNVLIGDDGGVGIIDFDRAGQAEGAYDAAYFLTHLWSFAIRHPRRRAQIRKLCDWFRSQYLGLAPEVSHARLMLYEALDFVAYVLRNFRKQSHQPPWIDWAAQQIEAAEERLGRLSGPEGALP